jgi:hypothetical protein
VHVDSRLHCSEIAISSRLGGRYGEESEVEDQVRNEKVCEEDQAQGGQEEVDQTAEDAVGVSNAKRSVAPAGEVESQ